MTSSHLVPTSSRTTSSPRPSLYRDEDEDEVKNRVAGTKSGTRSTERIEVRFSRRSTTIAISRRREEFPPGWGQVT